MPTGDLATMDEQGYVNIVGRIEDMIIRRGENIYPREVEEFLHTHPTRWHSARARSGVERLKLTCAQFPPGARVLNRAWRDGVAADPTGEKSFHADHRHQARVGRRGMARMCETHCTERTRASAGAVRRRSGSRRLRLAQC